MDIKDLLGKAEWELKHNRGAVIAVAVLAAIMAVEIAVYLPIRSLLKSSATELMVRTKEAETARTTGLTRIGPVELAKLQQRTQAAKQGFVNPAEISAVLDRISDQAEKKKVHVVSINSEEPVSMKTDDKDKSQNFTRFPIRMNLEGGYRPIAEFVRALAQVSQQVFVVESYKISKSKEGGSLECEMVLSFFSDQ